MRTHHFKEARLGLRKTLATCPLTAMDLGPFTGNLQSFSCSTLEAYGLSLVHY